MQVDSSNTEGLNWFLIRRKFPPSRGKAPPLGGKDPRVGGFHPPLGGNHPPSGGNAPPIGGNDPRLGGFRPPFGGNHPRCGGKPPPTGGKDPPDGALQKNMNSQSISAINKPKVGRRRQPALKKHRFYHYPQKQPNSSPSTILKNSSSVFTSGSGS